jgi:hypothetical protein
LWAAMFGMMALQVFTFTSLFVGVPVDETRYITPELRVGRADPPKTIELVPLDYSTFFERAHEALAQRPKWAKASSLTDWQSWATNSLDSMQIRDAKQAFIMYESGPSKGYYKPFSGKFVFKGMDGEPIDVKLLDAVALVQRADSGTSSSIAMPRYQQVEWWIEEEPYASQQNPGQVVSENAIKGLVLNAGDVIVLLVHLEALKKPLPKDSVTQTAYAAYLLRE